MHLKMLRSLIITSKFSTKILSSHLLINGYFPPYSSPYSSLASLQRVTCLPNKVSCKTTYGDKFKCMSTLGTNTQKEEVVIIGGGIAGLATALALHRLGIRSLVLEQSDSLRTGGTSLTLSKNGWRVLDVLGVGNELRSQFLEIQGMLIKTEEGKELRSFMLKDVDQSQELRAVERGTLLRTLAAQLPQNSLQFSSKLANIENDDGTGETKLELTNGAQLSAKIVIGCDGIRSPIARWMGFREPKYSGHCAFRGLAYYPGGQPYQPIVNYIYGRGRRAGFVPVSPNKVYWFICYNSSFPGTVVTDHSVLKSQALDLVKSWPFDLPDIIHHTPEDTIIRSPLEDRWLWPAVTPPVSKGGVVLAGDAWHPMTPNLGQGACCALEDAVVLAKKLSGAMKSGQGSINDALKLYGDERWHRIFPMTIKANLGGKVLQWKNPLACSVRNGYVARLAQIGPLLEHTNYTCEPL